MAKRDDGRWTSAVLEWSVSGRRAHRRPVTRWADCINNFLVGSNFIGAAHWLMLARNREDWKNLEEAFVSFAGEDNDEGVRIYGCTLSSSK